ncbi:MAG: UDP-N-acetylglucosamine 2-epimerase (hydrolyzing) [Gammaproteobacteria bacterium]|nr:UDP-N-acetylglucosamine 2-epimerase (hydrolyzing) [Gammaproteobacteria bacterium]
MRKVFIITERRADYSRFQPILELIKKDPNLDYDLVVTGLHLKKEHGFTINEIKSDGFKIFSTFEMFNEDKDTGGAMVRAYAKAVEMVTYELEKSKPDIILSGFDIAANAAVTIAGAHMNIPVAHIQGGEVTGTIDESIRHSMSKFAHYHFAANQDACERLIKMGEVSERVFDVGCPSIDAILSVEKDSKILKKFNLKTPYFLLIQHPVTTEISQSEFQIKETLSAIVEANINTLIILPNNDAGYSKIMDQIKSSKILSVDTLSIKDYVNLLRHSSGLIGNSSSGIHEAASFNIPVVNIGTRQQGRLRPENVIDVDHNVDKIVIALNKCLAIKNKNISFDNPYGDGKSSQRIVDLLKTLDIDEKIIQKRITY